MVARKFSTQSVRIRLSPGSYHASQLLICRKVHQLFSAVKKKRCPAQDKEEEEEKITTSLLEKDLAMGEINTGGQTIKLYWSSCVWHLCG